LFEIIPHTADVRLRVVAATLEELFTDAMRGMYAILRANLPDDGEPVKVSFTIDEAVDTTDMLIDFLNDVLHRAHTYREVYIDWDFLRLDATSLDVTLFGLAPASFEEDVKAVTYHEADVRRDEGGWTTMLVFDI
jgi:SHS2 domain-containing protein